MLSQYLYFYETVHSKNLEYLQRLTHEELKELCLENPNRRAKEANQDGKEWDYDAVVRGIFKMGAEQKMKYRFAKGQKAGRRYVTHTKSQYGIQNLPANIRGFLCPHYHDYDIVNCHFALLLQLASQHGLPRPYLTRYVEHRAEVLEETGMTKMDMITRVLNMDKPKLSHPWVVNFRAEVVTMRDRLLDIYNPTTTNTKNPLSSRFGSILKTKENEMLEKVLSHCEPKEAVLMYDGFMCREEVDVAKLRELTGVAWAEKPQDDSIEIDDEVWEREVQDYRAAQTRFEEHSFITLDPFVCYTELKGGKLVSYDLNTFRSIHANVLYEEKGKEQTDFVARWMRDKTRREYDRIVFDVNPNFDNDAEYNTFGGFVMARRSDGEAEFEGTTIEALRLERFFHHISLLCKFVVSDIEYLLHFLAHLIQYPHINPEVAIVMVGLQGAGKDKLVWILRQLIGAEYVTSCADGNRMFGNFNSLISRKLVVSLNEMDGKDGRKFYQRIKDAITADKNVIRKLYQEGVEENNQIRWFLFSNSDDALPVLKDDRKWIIFRTSNEKKDDKSWWMRYVVEDLEGDPTYLRRIYHFLKHRDIGGWNPRCNIVTDCKRNMLACNDKTPIDFIEQFDWERKAKDEDGLPAFLVHHKTINKAELNYIHFSDLWDYWKMWDDTNAKLTPKQFKRNIQRVDGVKLDHKIDGARYVSVDLDKMRKDIGYHTSYVD